jgi:hypothetical protein
VYLTQSNRLFYHTGINTYEYAFEGEDEPIIDPEDFLRSPAPKITLISRNIDSQCDTDGDLSTVEITGYWKWNGQSAFSEGNCSLSAGYHVSV